MTPTKNEYLNQLYSYKYPCSSYGKTCEEKRQKCQEYAANYYDTAIKQEEYQHIDCQDNSWTGGSYIDPRPTGYDRYIDYLRGTTTAERPSHGHYGRLPYTNVQGPSYEDLRNICDNLSQGNVDEDVYSAGRICGRGTTWHPLRKQCIRMQDDYTTYDGIGYQYQRPVYPYIRSEGDKRCYDNPDDIYTYIDAEQQQVYNSSPHGTGNCFAVCAADRCRFPLTSKLGQHQAKLYVNLFREVYEYAGSDPNKVLRRTRIRTLIDNHWSFTGFHGNGVFLPWHRWYLLEMETILMQHQAESPNDCKNTFYGIPYFDWHNLPCEVNPKDFINNPVFHSSLGEPTPTNWPAAGCVGGGLSGFMLTTPLPPCLTRSWTSADAEKFPEINLHPLYPLPTNYDQFRAHLENFSGLHGPVHCIVGGIMCSFRSPNDPLFFNHHANVDKIWHDWQTQSVAHQNMYVGSIPLMSLMPASTATPADMLDLNNLVYTPPLGSPVTISVEYVDMDTSGEMGDGNTFSR